MPVCVIPSPHSTTPARSLIPMDLVLVFTIMAGPWNCQHNSLVNVFVVGYYCRHFGMTAKNSKTKNGSCAQLALSI